MVSQRRRWRALAPAVQAAENEAPPHGAAPTGRRIPRAQHDTAAARLRGCTHHTRRSSRPRPRAAWEEPPSWTASMGTGARSRAGRSSSAPTSLGCAERLLACPLRGEVGALAPTSSQSLRRACAGQGQERCATRHHGMRVVQEDWGGARVRAWCPAPPGQAGRQVCTMPKCATACTHLAVWAWACTSRSCGGCSCSSWPWPSLR